MRFIDYKPRHNSEVFDELRRETKGPFPKGTMILDNRWGLASTPFRVEADQETIQEIEDGARATYIQRLSAPDSKAHEREAAAKALANSREPPRSRR